MKLFGLIFSLPFIGGPIAMLVMLWDNDSLGAPPLPMQIFGSLICVAVASAGFCMAYSVITGKNLARDKVTKSGNIPDSIQSNYSCRNCGAGIGVDSEISPSGDVKCEYCNSWFNVNA